jgi:hypothetical protein
MLKPILLSLGTKQGCLFSSVNITLEFFAVEYDRGNASKLKEEIILSIFVGVYIENLKNIIKNPTRNDK